MIFFGFSMKVVLAFGFYGKGLSTAEPCERMWMADQKKEEMPFEVTFFVFVFRTFFRVDMDA